MYDIIGDIHGHYGKLERLLIKLGYEHNGVYWVPPHGRKAVFIGDLIDRGPEQIKVVMAVRAMMERGHAYCILGNHELNAIGFATPHPDDYFARIRPRSEKNRAQHQTFLDQVGEDSDLHREMVEWFRSLPVYLELDGIRVVHAMWDETYLDDVICHAFGRDGINNHQLCYALDKKAWKGGPHPLYHALDGLCKGREIDLPDGAHFTDHNGHVRKQARIKWWKHDAKFMHEVAIVEGAIPESLLWKPIPDDLLLAPVTGTPIFIGHYWMKGEPAILGPKVACVDYSAGKGGPLVAYRWNGESELHDGGFVSSN
jgi:hypothetical protein